MSNETSALQNVTNANGTGKSCVNYTVYNTPVGPMDLTHITLQCIVFLLGLSGNIILIFIIATHRRLRTTPNLFITNLAAADCIYLILFIPCDIVSKFGIQLPIFFCKTIYFCRFLTVGVSVYTLVALAIDRCLAITRPMSNLKSSRPGLVPKLGLVVIWIAAIALAVPYAVSSSIGEKRHRCFLVRHCYPFPDTWGQTYSTVMVMLKLVLYFLLPGIVIAVFYGLMAGKLMRTARAHERSASAEANSSAVGQIESRRKLARLVLCLSGVFFVAWGLDYAVMLYFFLAKRVPQSFIWIKMLAKLLPSAYSASNPITLCIISKRFRAHFLEVVTYGRRRAAAGGAGVGGGAGGGVMGYRSGAEVSRVPGGGRRGNSVGVGRGGGGGRGSGCSVGGGGGSGSDGGGGGVASAGSRRHRMSTSINMTNLMPGGGRDASSENEAEPMLATCQV